MTDTSFNRLRKNIYDLTGIYYTDSKKYLLESKILRRIGELEKINSFDEYIDLICGFQGRSEHNQLFDAVTINETYFFRAEQQFQAFEDILIEDIIKNKSPYDKKIQIWSAASSTGEEAYTIAMIIDNKLSIKYPGYQFEIIATDINSSVVESAKKGIYKDYAVRNIPQDYMRKYFKKVDNVYHLADRIKKMVTFRFGNLYSDTDMQKMRGTDIIWCCNVLIYFDIPSKQKVVDKLHKVLNPGGYLYIGYSESLHGINRNFNLIHLPKAMVYKKEK